MVRELVEENRSPKMYSRIVRWNWMKTHYFSIVEHSNESHRCTRLIQLWCNASGGNSNIFKTRRLSKVDRKVELKNNGKWFVLPTSRLWICDRERSDMFNTFEIRRSAFKFVWSSSSVSSQVLIGGYKFIFFRTFSQQDIFSFIHKNIKSHRTRHKRIQFFTSSNVNRKLRQRCAWKINKNVLQPTSFFISGSLRFFVCPLKFFITLEFEVWTESERNGHVHSQFETSLTPSICLQTEEV